MQGAGAGQLTVRVRGPKGAFNVEMQRERKNDRTIHCKYEPREPGDYQIEVSFLPSFCLCLHATASSCSR